MTRRGTLAYYLAAWVCGAFFFSLARAVTQPTHVDFPTALLMVFFIMSALAWPALLLFALLLRRTAKALVLPRAAAWIAAGGTLSLLIGAALSPFQGAPAFTVRSWIRFQARLFTVRGFSENPYDVGWKVNTLGTLLAGMATAYLLYRVDHAFAGRDGASK